MRPLDHRETGFVGGALIVIIDRESDQRKDPAAKPVDRPTPAGKTLDVTFRRESKDCDQSNTEGEP